MSKKLILVAVLVLAIVVGVAAIVYAAAVRNPDAQVGVAAVTSSTVSDVTSDSGSATFDTAPVVTTSSESSAGSGETEYTATDDSYDSDKTSISITQVSSGSGKDKVTYYVADVKLTPGTDLQSAFAEGYQLGKVAFTSSIAAANDAVLAINGDYCTARNTGVIIRNGVVCLDSPARMGLAIYDDGTMKVYDETTATSDQLISDGVRNTFSFGPALLVDGSIPDGLDSGEVEDIGEEHTILGSQPRAGVGIVEAYHYVFVVVDGRSPGYSMGATLSDFAQIFKGLGCTTAYNLDGGGSAAMYFMGKLVNNPLGSGRERGISDILYVK